MTEMFQRPKCITKYDRNVSVKKSKTGTEYKQH